MTAWMRVALLMGVTLAMPGCATMAMNAALRAAHPQPAWDGRVAIVSEPAGAACRVMRGDRVVAEVPATPGTVELTRSHAILEVRCRADGFVETAEVLRPRDDPAVFRMAPNGIIGATATVISLAGALTMRYPGEVIVALPPEVFASEAEQERWFAGRRDQILAARATEIALAEDRCRTVTEGSCDPNLMVMRQEQEDDLRRLDALRDRAGLATQVAEAR